MAFPVLAAFLLASQMPPRESVVPAGHWHGLEIESFPDGVPGFSGIGDKIMPPDRRGRRESSGVLQAGAELPSCERQR
jgi:hypothetical protein